MAESTNHGSQESLFSLELAVEKLNLKDVTCRFPAVAFRLLDFPTLIIYHVEPDLAKTIKAKIEADGNYKIGPQLQELQDKNGDFLVQRGKSCLFKLSPQTLQTHLSNTPLYVMVIDTFPEVPKLIGSCSVPMDSVMDQIMVDIDKLSLSVPSVHGEHGVHKIYNLMGYEIGSISMGFRLLSLGMGLIPHIPNNAIAKRNKVNQSNSNVPKATPNGNLGISEVANIMLSDIQAADKTIQVSLSAGLATECQLTQTAHASVNTAAVQTSKRARIKEQQRQRQSQQRKQRSEPEDYFFVVNTVCPPPLFYNSEAPNPQMSSGLTFIERSTGGKTSDKYTEFGDTHADDPLSFDVDDLSEEDTIRLEDNFDSDIEDNVDFKTSRIIRTEASHTTKSGTRKTYYTESHQTQQSIAVRSSGGEMPVVGNLTQFPMLNALLNEIMALQGHVPSKHRQQAVSQQPSIPPSTPSHYEHPSPRFSTPPASPAPPVRSKAEREAILARLATPRGSTATAGSGRHSHRGCTETHDQKPRSSISSRRDSQLSVKKTKLAYGMTNTQRLRLAKIKPELLKQLEKEEAIRLSKRRMSEKQKEKAEGKPGDGQRTASWPHLNGVSMHSSLDETGDMSLQTSSEWRKRPVPTPRKSIQMRTGSTSFYSDDLTESQRQTGLFTDSRLSGLAEYAGVERSEEGITDSQSSPLHMPSASLQESDADTSRGRSPIAYEEPSKLGLTRTINKPGFPSEVIQSRGSIASRGSRMSRVSSIGQYSDDFDLSHVASSAEELGFKKVVDKYSDSSEASTKGTEPILRKVMESYSPSEQDSLSGEEPVLRRMVETYSDEEKYASQLRRAANEISDNSESTNYHSAQSDASDEPRNQAPEPVNKKLQLQMSTHKVPLASGASPVVAMRPTGFVTREGAVASSTLAATESYESTAFISRSQIPSDTATSVESASVDTRVTQRPKPSPRQPVKRVSSVHTESVSSYSPSDDEEDSPLEEVGEDAYSEAFDTDSDSATGQAKQMKDLSLDPRAKMGYTWT